MQNPNMNSPSLPQLMGQSNFREWKHRATLALKQLTLAKKQSAQDLEIRSQSLLVNAVSDKILGRIMHCSTADEIMVKLNQLYGPRDEDCDELQVEFHSFKYNNDETLQENVSRLEVIRQKLTDLGESVSDSAFRTKLLKSLPSRFNSFKSANKLVRVDLDMLIKALSLEDRELQQRFEERKRKPVAMISSSTSNGSTRNKSQMNLKKSNQPGNSSNVGKNSNSIICNYCKESGHIVKSCPVLEKRANAVCNKCKEKGHFAKNCVAEQKSSTSEPEKKTIACVGVGSSKELDRTMWILDCGSTDHVCNDRNKFSTLEPVKAGILVGDSCTLDINFKGTVLCDNGSCDLLFNDVLLNENSPFNLISVYRLLSSGWEVKELSLSNFILEKESFNITATLDDNNLWVVIFDSANVVSGCSLLSLAKWHKRFAHQNLEYTKELLNRLNVKYEKVPNDFRCVDCVKGKISILPFPKSDFVATELGQLTHSDLLISPSLSIGGSKYALCLKDDFSRYRTVYFIKSKAESVECFKDYFERLRNVTGKNPKYLRSDNGTEEVNSEIDDLTSSLGIIHQLTCPFTPQQNGRIERDMRTLSEAVTTVLIDSGLEKEFWAEALSYVVFTLNRVSKGRDGKTPYELFYNSEPFDVNWLRPFGAEVVVQIPSEKRKKFDPKGEEGVFVGYQLNTKGYKVFLRNSKKFTVSRNVIFVEKTDVNKLENSTLEKKDDVVSNDNEEENLETVVIDYDWDFDSNESETEAISLLNVLSVPEAYSDLCKMETEERRIWEQAIKKELEAMERYEVWEEVSELPEGSKAIDTRWVFVKKSGLEGEIAKARLVAKGCQLKGSASVSNYAPVVGVVTVKVFLAMVVNMGLVLVQADVETAFLNGILKELVFVKPPNGYQKKGKENVIWLRLLKALYGLPQSSKYWYYRLKEILLKLGFKILSIEACWFILKKDSCLVMIIVYVDDLLIAGSNEDVVNFVLSELSKYFCIKVMKDVDTFIGLGIELVKEGLVINQTKYIEKCVKRYGLEFARDVKSPMEEKLKLDFLNSDNKELCVKKFQQLLGSINYVMERCRPDVNFAVNFLSRFTMKATEELYRYLSRVLRYLGSTKELKMSYVCDMNTVPIDAYCDASWASEPDMKSTTGYVIRVFGNIVHYKTRKQSIVALSTCESEYISLSDCAKDVMWLRNLLLEIGINVGTCVIFCDNQSAIKLANSDANFKRSRHISIKYHFIQDLIEKGLIKLEYIESKKNLADFMTKALSSEKIKFAMSSLGFN